MPKQVREAKNVVLLVVVGSQLHGLAGPDSDTDTKGVFKHAAIDIISPFTRVGSETFRLGEGEDNTAFELRDFCKLATKGNGTILEMLWSNMVRQASPVGEEMQLGRQKFLDSKLVFEAHRGYAANQFKKMNLWSPTDRTPKFCAAYIRVLIQGIQLLRTGDFNPQVEDGWPKMFLRRVKFSKPEDFVSGTLRRDVWEAFNYLQTELAQAYYEYPDQFTSDIPWIESLLEAAYL